MGPNSSPCLTLLTALVSFTSALGMFNSPRETEKYQQDLLDTLFHVIAKGDERSLQDVLRDAFLAPPYPLEGYDDYNLGLNAKLNHDFDEDYNRLIQLVNIDGMLTKYEDGNDIEEVLSTGKRGISSRLRQKLFIESEGPTELIQPKEKSRTKTRPRPKQKGTCPPSQDGIIPIMCPNTNTCLSDSMICDGNKDCPKNEDEDFTLCVVRRWFKDLEKKLTVRTEAPSA